MGGAAPFLEGDAAFLALAVAGPFVFDKRFGRALIYGGALAISCFLTAAAVNALFGVAGEALVLPLGVPWVRMWFNVDPLSAFFSSSST